uniref:ribonuclease Z n=1 Tax=Hypnea pseudomusciformis TaxID=1545697 RepID=UPI0027D9F1CC|nr:ribonuclease Z [Hypnea pseudomusciformis]WCH55045.1 ribonuclease Z [Hypnea pseudomusciformis]WCH55444.1 ribonuclease Z [Hypnea pseudomusciformis]WCH56638.1 ribonuclease Z [Hypnea pseudomusciformis]
MSTLNRKKKLKINQISNIIITEKNIDNISGLLGLLSSLSLINRKKKLNIYVSKGIEKYIILGKKYAKTNFRYCIYLHILKTGLIIKNQEYQIYTFNNQFIFEFLLTAKNKYGQFKLNKAQKFQFPVGPIYGKLKNGYSFLLPDGIIIEGYKFTNFHNSGVKNSILINKYHTRNSIEMSYKSKIIEHKFIV